MRLFVLGVLGAVLVHNSAAQDPAGDVTETNLYTDSEDFTTYTPETTTPLPPGYDEDLVMDMLLEEDGVQRPRVTGPPDARDPLLHPGGANAAGPVIQRTHPKVGYHCGVFRNPWFYGELRVVNETKFLLRKVTINPQLPYVELRVIFKGPNLVIPMHFNINSPEKSLLHTKLFIMDPNQVLANLDEVTIEDDTKKFSISLNISRCRTPPPQTAKPQETKNGRNASASSVLRRRLRNIVVIKDFTYSGNCPAAFFWAGTGSNPEDGFKVPALDSSSRHSFSSEPLRVVKNEYMVLQLPDFTTIDKLDYIGVYCPANGQMLGNHLLKPSS